jgi:hypothetical protein
MQWRPVAKRDAPPLVLAGPVVRRVEPTGASVWLALSRPDTVRLTVLDSQKPVASNGSGQATVPLGDNLHVIVVTAVPTPSPLEPGVTYSYVLEFGSVDGTGRANFDAALGGNLGDLVYPSVGGGRVDPLPTFALPPRTLGDLQVVHTSCRKAHGEGGDALPVLDGLISAMRQAAPDDAGFALNRPHQLFLTGDQTYSDDVADAMLAMAIAAGGWLMGARKESPPARVGPLAGAWEPGSWFDASAFFGLPEGSSYPWHVVGGKPHPWPGVHERALHIYAAGFTVSPPTELLKQERLWRSEQPLVLKPTQPDRANRPGDNDFSLGANHIMALGEFYAMPLLAWSPVLWDEPSAGGNLPLPFVDDLDMAAWARTLPPYLTEDVRTKIVEATASLRSFHAGLGCVRRVLANVPTYMVFDDHDVTDDWYINREWCDRVLTTRDGLGPRIIRNALVAYAVMQAWGNTPEQFAAGTTQGGRILLDQLSTGTDVGSGLDSPATGAGPSVSDLVGLPTRPLAQVAGMGTTTALERSDQSLQWHYGWAHEGWPFEVLVLDCRNHRGYPAGSVVPAVLLDDGDGVRANQLTTQVPTPDHTAGSNLVTLVVVQTPLLGLRVVEGFQETSTVEKVFDRDAESWSISPRAFEGLLARLVAHNPLTVVMSGDVHYAMATTADYEGTRPWGTDAPPPLPIRARIVQLTSSSSHNETSHGHSTRSLHTWSRSATTLSDGLFLAFHEYPLNHQGQPLPGPSRVSVRPRTPFVLSLTEYAQLFRSLPAPEPDWTYRVVTRPGEIVNHPPPPPPTVTDLALFGPLLAKSGAAWWHSTDGKNIVGVNNVGLVTFSGSTAADIHVVQSSYWRSEDPTRTIGEPGTITTFDCPLQFHDLSGPA